MGSRERGRGRIVKRERGGNREQREGRHPTARGRMHSRKHSQRFMTIGIKNEIRTCHTVAIAMEARRVASLLQVQVQA